MLILRWVAFAEAEREAVAAFDEKQFESFLPQGLQQQAWVRGTIRDHIDSDLGTLEINRLGGATGRLVASVAQTLAHTRSKNAELFDLLVVWVTSLDVSEIGGRQRAATEFDEVLLRALAAQGRLGGEYTTPPRVVELMVGLAAPQPGDRVYDPCFGVASLLVEAAHRMRRTVVTADPTRWRDVQSNGIFGVEINRSAYLVGLCRVLLAGIDSPGLELGDALERPLPRNRAVEGFDVILAAPPWGGRAADAHFRHFPVPTGGTENLFLQHVMANLRPGGRAVIALPEGALFRTGPDRQVRKSLLEEFRVDGVVSLPPGAFAPCTGIPSSLVVFRRDTPRSDVRFVQIPPKAWDAGDGDGFGDGDGHGFGSGSGSGAGDGTGYGDGSGSGLGHGDGFGVPDGSGYGDGRSVQRRRTSGVLRKVAAVLRHDAALPADGMEHGIDAWSVPVRSLAARDFELLAKRTGAEELETTLERLAATDADLKIVTLDQVAKVFQGVSYDRKLTTERRSSDVLAALVRVGDISESKVKQPSLFFTREADSRVRDEHRLGPGDMLITTSGTVGKIGVIEDGNELVGALATKSLVVIRPSDGATPAFIAALLRSPSYQEWFAGHARGSTIQHLSVRTLRKMKVPVPPVQIQEAVLRHLSSGGDALALLLRFTSGGTSDPIAAWLERPPVVAAISGKVDANDPAKTLAALGKELLQLRALRNRAAHADAPEVPVSLTAWLLAAVEVGAVLDGVDGIPEGAPRLAALELARAKLATAHRGTSDEDSPLANRVQAFVSSLERLVERAAQAMLGSGEIQLRTTPNELAVGVPTEVQLELVNASNMALRRIEITTAPDVGGGTSGYVAEGATASVPLTVKALDAADSFKIGVRWAGVRLDGASIRGQRTIELLVKSTRDDVLAGDLGASPYIVGNPVDREEMFFGRSDVVDRIKRQLGSATNANVILLEGNRRTGKTSILRQLQKPDALSGWIAVYCSFQDAEGDESRAGISTRNVYRLMARTLGWSLYDAGVRTWFPGEPAPESKRPFKVEFRKALDQAFKSEHPFEVLEEYLAAALAAAKPRRVLLMLDEFDKLQEGIDSGVTSPQVPENIRHILQHHEGVSAILTGSRRLKRLREEYWSALFGLGYRLGISALPLEDAQRLVSEPVASRLRYLPMARDRLVDICARQPFLVQSLCNRVFERAAESGDRTVTIANVDEAATEMVRDNEHFRTLWDYAQTHRRRLLLALCERLAHEPDAVNLELLSTKLESLGVQVAKESELGDDLEYLRELELVELDKSYRGGTYRVAVPLLGMWIRTSIDFDDAVARAREEAQGEHP
ncbi:MAG: N-6 DNA methylase [Planctomycetota bacterium]